MKISKEHEGEQHFMTQWCFGGELGCRNNMNFIWGLLNPTVTSLLPLCTLTFSKLHHKWEARWHISFIKERNSVKLELGILETAPRRKIRAESSPNSWEVCRPPCAALLGTTRRPTREPHLLSLTTEALSPHYPSRAEQESCPHLHPGSEAV